MGCPNTTATGCRCPEHHPGLSIHAPDQDAYTRALTPLRGPVRLSIVTFGPNTEPVCTDDMLCVCPKHTAERATLVRRGGQGAGNANPFKTRQAA